MPGETAYGAVAAVAADQPAGAQRAGRGADEDAVAGVLQRGHLHPAPHGGPEPYGVLGEQRLQPLLGHHPRPLDGGVRGQVGVGPVDQAGVEGHAREVAGEAEDSVGGRAAEGAHPAQRLPLDRLGRGQQPAPVQRLGRRHVDRCAFIAGSGASRRSSTGTHTPGERQLGGEHQAHRPGAAMVTSTSRSLFTNRCSMYERFVSSYSVPGGRREAPRGRPPAAAPAKPGPRPGAERTRSPWTAGRHRVRHRRHGGL